MGIYGYLAEFSCLTHLLNIPFTVIMRKSNRKRRRKTQVTIGIPYFVTALGYKFIRCDMIIRMMSLKAPMALKFLFCDKK